MSKLNSGSPHAAATPGLKESLVEILSFILALAIAIPAAAFAVHRTFGRDGSPFLISGDSMNPTLTDRQQIFANPAPDRVPSGAIVISLMPEAGYRFTSEAGIQYIVKRVIAGPGETVDIGTDDVILVNNIPIEETYLSPAAKSETYVPNVQTHYKLAAGEYFIVGDNRAHSCDSRYFGPVKYGQIIGVVNENTINPLFMIDFLIKDVGSIILLYLLSKLLLTILLRKAFKV